MNPPAAPQSEPSAAEAEVVAHAERVLARIRASRKGVRTWRRPSARAKQEVAPPAHLRGCPPERE